MGTLSEKAREGRSQMPHELKSVATACGGVLVTRARLGLAAIVAVAIVCAYVLLISLDGSQQAKATPSAPAFVGEVAESEVPGGLSSDKAAEVKDVAADPKTGDIYIVGGNRVLKLTPYGRFILSFGWQVDKTKVEEIQAKQAKGETPTAAELEAEDLCTAASGDDCSNKGQTGYTGEHFAELAAAAVERSTGDVYVEDSQADRIYKYDPSGHFLLTFGKHVNKVKTQTLSATPTTQELEEADICVAGEECQDGEPGKGPGEFEGLNYNLKDIAVGGPEGKELVYVGDKARIQVFTSADKYKQALSLAGVSPTAVVSQIAADSTGNVFFSDEGVAGAHLADTNGGGELELTSTIFDNSSTTVEGLTATGGSLYVLDGSKPAHAHVYEVANPSATPAEFAGSEPGQVYLPAGIAVDGIGTVTIGTRTEVASVSGLGSVQYVAHGHNGIDFYGSLAAMEAKYGPSPVLAPVVTELAQAEPDETTADLTAEINPQLHEAKYQFEFGSSPCAKGGCTKLSVAPVSLGSVTKTEHQVLAPLSELQPEKIYYYRLTVTSPAGTIERPERAFAVGRSSAVGPTGLPDGRVYEQVSPGNKLGSEVLPKQPSFAASDGQAALYGARSAISSDATSNDGEPAFVSERTSHGWVTRSATPLPSEGPETPEQYTTVASAFLRLEVPSANLSSLLFDLASRAPFTGSRNEALGRGNNVYIEGSDPFAEPTWVGRSLIEGSPEGVGCGNYACRDNFIVAGASPDLSTIYFYFKGELLPGASGLYEYRNGVLSDAGVLPGGEAGAGAAVPAAQPVGHDNGLIDEEGSVATDAFDNQVSADGSRIFFVREDAAGALELYARVTAPDGSQRTLLVSRSQMPGHVGQAAPDGPLAVASTRWIRTQPTIVGDRGKSSPPSYVFASPDGSHAFFQSSDRLTPDAPENGVAKTYEFDLETETLEYLPGLVGSIVTVSPNGSWLMFENTKTSPLSLERWVAGPAGGTVTPITQLPEAPEATPNVCAVQCVGPTDMSKNGEVVVFTTTSKIPGFNDNGSRPEFYSQNPLFPDWEIFRYDAESGELSCVSCPPHGMTPSGDAIISPLTLNGESHYVTTPGNAISADGSRVFFETPDALVPQDINGVNDVYEWENGTVYLISSGHSPEASHLVGASESGNDAFFMTTEGISPGDTDGAYDVYDARVPRPGDKPVQALPCEGAVCQGPPSVPNLLGTPASEAFSGPGDLVPPPPASHPAVKAKPLTRAQKLARALKACEHEKKARRRRLCERRARQKYGAKAAKADGRTRQGNGRGN